MAKPKLQPFTTKELDLIEFMYGNGIPLESIAPRFNICLRTFQKKIKITPGGKCALLKGKTNMDGIVLQSTVNMIRKEKYPVLNIFYLKTRMGWKDQSKDKEHTIVINNNIPSESEDDKINRLREQHLAFLQKEKECSQILSSVPLSPQDSASLPSASPGELLKPK